MFPTVVTSPSVALVVARTSRSPSVVNFSCWPISNTSARIVSESSPTIVARSGIGRCDNGATSTSVCSRTLPSGPTPPTSSAKTMSPAVVVPTSRSGEPLPLPPETGGENAASTVLPNRTTPARATSVERSTVSCSITTAPSYRWSPSVVTLPPAIALAPLTRRLPSSRCPPTAPSKRVDPATIERSELPGAALSSVLANKASEAKSVRSPSTSTLPK